MKNKRKYPFPPNMTYDKTNDVYRYFRKDKKAYCSLGKDLNTAIAATKKLNEQFSVHSRMTMAAWCVHFKKSILPSLSLSKTTVKEYLREMSHIEKQMGSIVLASATVKDVASFLKQFPPTAQSRYRALVATLFRFAMANGHRPIEAQNPALATIPTKVTVQRTRFTLDGFASVYQAAVPVIQRAMALGIVTLQRRTDLTRMKFRYIKENEGVLYLIQSKSRMPLKLDLNLAIAGFRLTDVIRSCRDMVGPHYLLHYPATSRAQFRGKKLSAEYLSRGVQDARDKSGIYDGCSLAERPTFHEIRALGAELYRQAGYPEEWIQMLLGHKTAKMTQLYLSRHQVQWVEIKART